MGVWQTICCMCSAGTPSLIKKNINPGVKPDISNFNFIAVISSIKFEQINRRQLSCNIRVEILEWYPNFSFVLCNVAKLKDYVT